MAEKWTFKKKKGYYRSIQRYIEFFMSDGNLRRDGFLRNTLNENLEVKMSIFLKFNRIRDMKANLEDIKTALRPSKTLELIEEDMVRKKLPIVERNKEEIDLCTLYVERIPPDITPEYLTKTFSSFGKVAYVAIPKYKKSKRIKGFAFVEFENESSCALALKKFATHGGVLGAKKNSESASSSNNLESSNETKLDSNEKLEEKKGDVVMSDSDDQNQTQPTKIKRNRKKKKSQRKPNPCYAYMGFQIMSKENWNDLRNRYLSLQAANRRNIKMQLSKIKRPSEQHSRITQLISGSVVAINCKHAVTESQTKAIKKNLGQIEGVEYIDIECGHSNGYIRLTSSDSASSFLQNASEVLPNFKADILSPTLESEYWSKIENDRKNKFKELKVKKNVSGGKKIFNRAEKLLGVKISNETTVPGSLYP